VTIKAKAAEAINLIMNSFPSIRFFEPWHGRGFDPTSLSHIKTKDPQRHPVTGQAFISGIRNSLFFVLILAHRNAELDLGPTLEPTCD